MQLGVKFIHAQDWLPMAKSAHLAVFGEETDADYDFIDYALLAVDEEKDTPLGYLTARRLNKELVNWSFGGAFKPIYGGPQVIQCYRAFINFQKEHIPCKRIITLIKNDNIRSLKLAMAHGFRIIGVKTYKEETMVELMLNFEEGISNGRTISGGRGASGSGLAQGDDGRQGQGRSPEAACG